MNNVPPKPTPEQIRYQAIADAGDAAMKLLTNHGAMQGVGVTMIIATGQTPMVFNSVRPDLAPQVLAAAAQQIAEHAKQAGPVALVDAAGLDLKALRNGKHT